MSKSIYGHLLELPLWQKRRLEIFAKDNWTCQRCGATDRQLHVHHLRYDLNVLPWEYPDSDYLTLCFLCHNAVHGGQEHVGPTDENQHRHRMTGKLGDITRLINEKNKLLAEEKDSDKQLDLMAEIKQLLEQKKHAFENNL